MISKKIIVVALTAFAIHLPISVQAQTTLKIQQAELPREIVSDGQKWQTYLHWYCLPAYLPKDFEFKDFVTTMNSQMNTIGAAGWEFVSLNKVDSSKQTCFLAAFKAPKK